MTEIKEPTMSGSGRPHVPRCWKCGYSYADCRWNMDHHLCGEPEPEPEPIPVSPLHQKIVKEFSTARLRTQEEYSADRALIAELASILHRLLNHQAKLPYDVYSWTEDDYHTARAALAKVAQPRQYVLSES